MKQKLIWLILLLPLILAIIPFPFFWMATMNRVIYLYIPLGLFASVSVIKYKGYKGWKKYLLIGFPIAFTAIVAADVYTEGALSIFKGSEPCGFSMCATEYFYLQRLTLALEILIASLIIGAPLSYLIKDRSLPIEHDKSSNPQEITIDSTRQL